MKERVQLAWAREQYAQALYWWRDSMRCYNIMVQSEADDAEDYAMIYLDKADQYHKEIEEIINLFGDQAKQEPTWWDKILLGCLGWVYLK